MTYYCNYVQTYFFLSVQLEEKILNIADTQLLLQY